MNALLHGESVTVTDAMAYDCIEGGCDHDEDECPTFDVTVCVDCMDEAGYGRDASRWDDFQPLSEWPHKDETKR